MADENLESTTDKDIFQSALGSEEPVQKPEPKAEEKPKEQPRDETGKFAPKAEEPTKVEPAKSEPAKIEAKPEPDKSDAIPAWRLREEAEARRAAEERAADFQRREAALRRQLQEARPVEKPIDLLEDPDGYARTLEQKVERKLLTRFLDASFEDARDQHGEKFDKAFAALEQVVQMGDTALRDRIVNSGNPGRALMRWHQDRETMGAISKSGGLDGYRKQVFEEALKDPEFRKRAMEAWRDEATGGQRPNTVTQLPSLNKATGAGNQPGDDEVLSDSELFKSVVPRRRYG